MRYFPNLDVSACIEFETDDSSPTFNYFSNRYIESCVFVEGQYTYRYGEKFPDKIPLKDINPTVISEMLFDMQSRIR